MTRTSILVATVAGAILISPAVSLAQTTGSGGASPSGATTTLGANSAGIAQSSGANTGPGVTTGSAGSLGTGTAPAPTTDSNTAINAENKTIDRKLNSICKGC